jgi:DNA processing protein
MARPSSSPASIPAPSPVFLPALDGRFPRSLADLARPSAGLWVDGRLPVAGERLLTIVGSRAARKIAIDAVAGLAADLARAGWGVVSGGALGIDAAAHRGALAGGAATFAVLGCGIDVVFPDRHRGLFREIAAAGGLLSEYGPGVAPRPGQFPVRNRLVAALGSAVIVAEARPRSGALITARLATELGRPLLAVPGSSGTDGLIARGTALPVSSAAEVEAALASAGAAAGFPAATLVAGALAPVVAAVAAGAPTADLVARRLGRPVGEVLGSLLEAELAGLLTRGPGGRFEVPRGN